jgi:hypothetical protein
MSEPDSADAASVSVARRVSGRLPADRYENAGDAEHEPEAPSARPGGDPQFQQKERRWQQHRNVEEIPVKSPDRSIQAFERGARGGGQAATRHEHRVGSFAHIGRGRRCQPDVRSRRVNGLQRQRAGLVRKDRRRHRHLSDGDRGTGGGRDTDVASHGVPCGNVDGSDLQTRSRIGEDAHAPHRERMDRACVEPIDVDQKAAEPVHEQVDATRIEPGSTVLLQASDAKGADLILDANSSRQLAQRSRVHEARWYLTVVQAQGTGEDHQEERRYQDDRQQERPEGREPVRRRRRR